MTLLAQLLAAGVLRPLDVQAARLLERCNGGFCQELTIAGAFASRATGQGHTCLPLSVLSGLLLQAGMEGSRFADPAQVRQILLATKVVGRPGDTRPLILDDEDQLSLLRFFRYEEEVASALRRRTLDLEEIATAEAGALLAELFPSATPHAGHVDWQRTAAALALFKRFLVISGGPGTGKTYTVARILAALVALSPKKMRIGLAAPTGKAALRLQESIRSAKTALPRHLAAALPDQAQTLHRLLGFQSAGHGFLYHIANPLHLDLLILDEASMTDVALMAALLTALPATCRVILLGDRNQLASVEAGNLFADICGNSASQWSNKLTEQLRQVTGSTFATTGLADPMADSIVLLQTSHRFRETGGISALAQAVSSGRGEALEKVLKSAYPDLHIEDQTGPTQTVWLRGQIDRFFTPLFTAASAQGALVELGRCRILCALREGPSGVEGINALAASIFRSKRFIAPGERWYRGMPIIILRNDYSLNLFNGDTGIVWPDEQGLLQAWFPHEDGGIRPIALARLPSWQTSYAITVHKSQGSEFLEVLLLLPHEDVQILTRELLYTGITRAREVLTVYGRRELFVRAVQRQVIRYSGLGGKLRQEQKDRAQPTGSTGL